MQLSPAYQEVSSQHQNYPAQIDVGKEAVTLAIVRQKASFLLQCSIWRIWTQMPNPILRHWHAKGALRPCSIAQASDACYHGNSAI